MIWRLIFFSMTLWRVSTAETLRVVVIEGDGAINNIRLQRAKEPVVRVETEAGKPVSDAVVHFSAPTQGPGIFFGDGRSTETVLSDIDGRATGRGLRPNKTAGQFEIRVTASYQGASTTTKIVQTNAEPVELRRSSSSKRIAILAIVGGAVAGGAAFAARGGGKSATSVPPAAATSAPGIVITPGTPSLGAP